MKINISGIGLKKPAREAEDFELDEEIIQPEEQEQELSTPKLKLPEFKTPKFGPYVSEERLSRIWGLEIAIGSIAAIAAVIIAAVA